MADLSFFEKRPGLLRLLPFYLVFIAIVLFLLYMVWPWKYALILTLWGG